MESVPGSQAAAPMPMMPRAAMSVAMLGARAPRIEPAMKTPDPGQHHLAPPQPVAQAAEGQHQRREQQGVSVDDPLEVGHRGVERLLQVVQRDAHDGGVEEGQEEDAAEGGERDARCPCRLAAEPNRPGPT